MTLDTLTDEQRATLPGWRDKWLAHGLNTSPLTDDEWERVRAGALAAARFTKLPDPVLVRTGSPLAAALAAPILGSLLTDTDAWGTLPVGAWCNSITDTDSELPADITTSVTRLVARSTGTRPGDPAVRDAVNTGVTLARDRRRSAWIGGNHWAATLAYLTWFRDVARLQLPGDLWPRLGALEGVCTAGPSAWYQFDDHLVVAVSDRPTGLHRDPQGRAHHDTGPAITYRDGWAINMWHGINVPDDFHGWDAARALAETNVEIRRCAIERVGWERLLDRLTLVAEAPDPGNPPHTLRLFDGELVRGLYDRPARLLVAVNGTPDKDGRRRVFGIPVPAEMSDPVAAAAALHDLDVDTYTRLERRT